MNGGEVATTSAPVHSLGDGNNQSQSPTQVFFGPIAKHNPSRKISPPCGTPRTTIAKPTIHKIEPKHTRGEGVVFGGFGCGGGGGGGGSAVSHEPGTTSKVHVVVL
jgi:hypothetical protein